MPPAVLVKVLYSAGDMMAEHFYGMIGAALMVMRDLSVRVVDGLSYPVESSHQVKVLAVHKESLIKKQVILRKYVSPHEHETPGQARYIHYVIISGSKQDVSVIFFRSRWKK